MSKRYNKAIYMSLKQLLIIFYQKKVKGILVPSEMSDMDADDRQLKEAMAGMIGQGLLVIKENKLSLSDDIRQMMDIISEADTIYRIGNRQMPQQFLYVHGDGAALLNIDEANSEMVRLECSDKEDFFEGLTEYPAMPEDCSGEGLPQEAEISAAMTIEEVLEIPEVIAVIDRYPRDSEKFAKRLVVSEKDGVAVLAHITPDATDRQRYNRKLLISALEEE